MAALCTLSMRRLVNVWIAVLVLFVIATGATAAQLNFEEAAARPKKIVVLYSYGQHFQAWATWSKAIRAELNRQSSWPLDIQEHSLVSARNGDDVAEAKFAEYLKALYAQRPPDLIVTLAAPAARFVQRYRADLFSTTPMLLAAVDPRRVDRSILSEQDAMVGVQFNPIVLVENILRLLPETTTIALINGNAPTERFWAGEMQRVLGPLLENKVELLSYGERSFAETLKAVASLPPHSAILFMQLNVDGTGAIYGDKEPLKSISKVAEAPIFTFDESYFNGEAVGGPMFSPTEGALPTAAVAVRMLGGEKAGGIKVPHVEFSAPKYDWRQLQRFNISESRLPAGSKIFFREPTAWERYSWQIALTLAVIFVQSGLISVLMLEHRWRRFAEVQSRQSMAELAHVNRFSTAGELTASIAHEINQPLGSILANTEAAQIILKSPKPDIGEVNEILGDILKEDRRAAEVIRRLHSLLQKVPFELKALDLNDLVRETVDFLSALAIGRKVELISDMSLDELPIVGDRIQLQQVILNLVLNGIDAMMNTPTKDRIISIRTLRSERFSELSVSDRGPGIPEDKLERVFEPFFTSKADGMGMGLSIARTIVEAHSGQIWAENRDHGGASFWIRLRLVR
jgi:signal transduction histidine kinase